MHELSLVIAAMKKVDAIAKSNNVEKVEKVIFQIGEISTVIPHFVTACYPAAVDGTWLEETELEIEMITASARCTDCNEIYNPVEERGICPACGSQNHEIITGREFVIKEIVCT